MNGSRSETLSLVVLAAGLGSRFGGSKQVAAVGPNGEALLDYAVYDAFRAGFRRVVFVVQRSFADEFHQRIGARIERSAGVSGKVAYAFQDLADLPAGCSPPDGRSKPWGTAHAVWCARQQVQGAFAVVNADDFYGRNAYVAMVEALGQHDGNDSDGRPRYALIGYPVDVTLSEHGAVTRAQCRTASDGSLVDVVERHRIQRRDGVIAWADEAGSWHALGPKTTVSMNFWGFTAQVFSQFEDLLTEFTGQQSGLDEFQLPTAVGQLVTRGQCRVDVLAAGREWFGMTYAPDQPLVEERIRQWIRQEHYPAALWPEA